MRGFRQIHIGLITGLLSLAACSPGSGGGSATPPWALGEQPNFSGSIVDWARGDAIAPGEGGIFAVTYATGDPDGADIGFGSIKADGSFTFGLQKGAVGVGGGLPPEQVLCAGLTRSNPQQKIANVDVMQVLALYVDGVHARPGGGVVISEGKLTTPSFKASYTFFYASADGTLKGSCDLGDDAGPTPINLELSEGWNSVRRDQNGFKTAALAEGARWYFINPLTAGQ